MIVELVMAVKALAADENIDVLYLCTDLLFYLSSNEESLCCETLA